MDNTQEVWLFRIPCGVDVKSLDGLVVKEANNSQLRVNYEGEGSFQLDVTKFDKENESNLRLLKHQDKKLVSSLTNISAYATVKKLNDVIVKHVPMPKKMGVEPVEDIIKQLASKRPKKSAEGKKKKRKR